MKGTGRRSGGLGGCGRGDEGWRNGRVRYERRKSESCHRTDLDRQRTEPVSPPLPLSLCKLWPSVKESSISSAPETAFVFFVALLDLRVVEGAPAADGVDISGRRTTSATSTVSERASTMPRLLWLSGRLASARVE